MPRKSQFKLSTAWLSLSRLPEKSAICDRTAAVQEVRAILKARKLGILTPAVYFAEPEASTIYMEKLDAKMLKELLVPGGLSSEGEQSSAMHVNLLNLGRLQRKHVCGACKATLL